MPYDEQLERVRPPEPRSAPPGGASAVQRSEVEGDEPVAEYIIPFDRNPLSVPGEQIIFGARFRDDSPNDYELHFAGTCGHFDSQGSGITTKTLQGINHRNIFFFIDPDWDECGEVNVTLELRRVDDQSVVQSEAWHFGLKTVFPETIDQQEGDEERANPSRYHYTLGPDRNEDDSDNYLHQTILETFGQRTSNLTVADLTEDYRTTHGLTSDQAITDHFFGTSSNNGTFTVEAGDTIADRHSGMQGGQPETYEEALTDYPRDVYVDLPQTYEAQPGVSLGNFTIRRILKADGSKVIRKWKVE